MGMDIFDKNLSAFLFNKTRRGLLSLLYRHPNETFYINQRPSPKGKKVRDQDPMVNGWPIRGVTTNSYLAYYDHKIVNQPPE